MHTRNANSRHQLCKEFTTFASASEKQQKEQKHTNCAHQPNLWGQKTMNAPLEGGGGFQVWLKDKYTKQNNKKNDNGKNLK